MTSSHICVTLGRPPLVRPVLPSPPESKHPQATFLDGICDTIHQDHQFQQSLDLDFARLWDTSVALHERPKQHWSQMEPALIFANRDPNRPKMNLERMKMDMARVDTNEVYNYANLVIYRPFLQLVVPSSSTRHLQLGSQSPDLSSVVASPADDPTLISACQNAANGAINVISALEHI
ncbi:uncharacterized protein BO97DRAFT_423075 [Aspergillus homomorphus CBS 101889]|uniref:Uncharacterized protein n=1 Tax=Aspergillus homomorphus (strain CBS 101889) TaxID=1450537 RepID=A0A395I381_ASPHC|nr:hypothetical protein BO97DRAFT_423075 [Aspergillus homomorphus CBS 101889]RAL14159.1 hypothetical protein BO97DRAFT_423075 [Aspergillus homomorphus CBS 101889]